MHKILFYDKFIICLYMKIIRIITNTRPRDSCREVFKSMEIMTLYSQYIYTLDFIQLIINTYLIQIMKFINIKLGITIIYTIQ